MRKLFLPAGLAAVFFTCLCLSLLPKNENAAAARSGNTFESPTEALDALQTLTKSRAYPNLDIPPAAYAQAWEFYRANFGGENSRMASSTFPGSWTSIGPNNIGGRTLCVALQPNDTGTVWMGSASGGLWKSTSGGMGQNAWTYVPTGFPILGVSSIAFHPTNPNIMFIGTGETYNYGTSTNGLTFRTTRGTHGMGIFKSTDGGATWTPSLNWTYQQNRGIWEILFNPLNPNTLYAATTEGVYKSTDLGVTWNQSLSAEMVTDLVIHETDTAMLMAGVGNLVSQNKGIYRTTNSGQTWSILNNGLPANTHTGRITLSLWDDDNDVAIAIINDAFNTVGVYKTTNKGNSWTQTSNQDLTGYQGWYAEGILIKPGDQNQVLVGGIDMHKSNTGGSNFFTVSGMTWGPDHVHSDIHDVIANPFDPNKVYIATDGGLYRSDDFGSTYYDCNDGYVTSQFYIGSISATDPFMALGGLQDNFTNQFFGMTYWQPVLGGDGSWNAIDPTDDWIQYASYQYLNVIKSYDRGQSFQDQIIYSPANPGGGSPAAFLAPFIVSPSATNVLYAGGDSLIRSNDGGMSWSVMGNVPLDNGNFILSIACSATDEDSIYVATAPDYGPMHVYRSSDGGSTTTDISAGLPDRFPRRIAVNPDNSREVYVVFSGFGTGHVFKSTNAGGTWTDISTSLPDVPFHSILIDPDFTNVIYAGCDFGLFVSTDGGATWVAHNSGMPDATMIFDLVASPSDRSLMAFTHGRGVYTRSLNDVVTGIAPVTGSIPFTLFPNPANEVLNVSLRQSEAAFLRIYNLQGQLLREEIVAGPRTLLDVSALPAGAYLLQLESKGKRSAKRFIKS